MAPTQPTKIALKEHKTTLSPIRKKPIPRKPQPKVTKSDTKPRANTQFPFIKLPGEIRNVIYEYALVDPEQTISIYYHQDRVGRGNNADYDRAVKRILMGRSDFHDCNWTKVSKERRKEAESDLDARLPFKWRLNGRICPELLLVCKQINVEATSYLYEKNYFVFLDTTAMNLFLRQCDNNVRFLRRIGLAYFDMKRTVTHQYSAFKQLIKADRLEAFVLGESCISSMHWRSFSWQYKPAETFYRVAGSWLWYLAGRKGDTDAALDCLYFSDQLREADYEIQQWQTFCKFPSRFGRHFSRSSGQEQMNFRAAVLKCMG